MGADAGVQLAQPDGLRQVVVRARLEPDDDVHLRRTGGQHDEHAAGLDAPELSADLDAVEIGKPEVEQDEVDVVNARPCDPVRSRPLP